MPTQPTLNAPRLWRTTLAVPLAVVMAGIPAVTATASAQASTTAQNTTTAQSTTTEQSSPGSGIDYSAPLTITRGGTYSGNWRATDFAAVYVNTEEPVILENCNVSSPGTSGFPMIQGAFHKRVTLTVRNCTGYGEVPAVKGMSAATFLSVTGGFREVNVLNNRLVGTGGISAYGNEEVRDQVVNIKYNVAENIDGRVSGGGYCAGTNHLYCHRSFAALVGLQPTPNVEVAWNQVINQPGRSAQEDVIIVQASQGTEQGPIRVHDNFILGAYNHAPSQVGVAYTGSGINIADPSLDPARQVAHSWAYDNQVVGFTNYGIGLSGGHANKAFGNRIVASNLLPDGSQVAKTFVGLALNNAHELGPDLFYDNEVTGNVVGDTWVNQYGNRTNNCLANGFGGSCFAVLPGNLDLNNPVTHPLVTRADEAAEYASWLRKLGDHAIDLGPVGYTAPAPEPAQTSGLPDLPVNPTTQNAVSVVARKASLVGEVANSSALDRVYFEMSRDSQFGQRWIQEVGKAGAPDANGVSRIECTAMERISDATGKVTQANLTPGITYYFRTVAVDRDGVRHQGQTKSFTTLSKPNVASTTVKETEVQAFSATVHASIGSVDVPLESVNYVVGREPTLTDQSNLTVVPSSDFDKTGRVSPQPSSVQLTGLRADTDYYVKAVATVPLPVGPGGAVVPVSSEGPVVKFTTKHDPLADQLTILPATEVIATKALIRARVAGTAGFGKVEFELGTDQRFLTDTITRDATRDQRWDADGDAGYNASARPVIKLPNGATTLGDLKPGTTYYFRAVGIDAAGVRHYGAVESFTTLLKPNVASTTVKSTEITSDSAIVRAAIGSVGVSLDSVTYVVGRESTLTDPDGLREVPALAFDTAARVAPQPSHTLLEGLQPKTEYYVRAVATVKLPVGEGGALVPVVTQGPIVKFRTA